VIKVIVGLGNPGRKYEFTRHNLGFRVIDTFAEKNGFKFEKKSKYNSFLSKFKNIFFIKPLTFVNLTGVAIKKFIDDNNISPQEVLVIIDDFSLNLGKIRYRQNGSSGGHKGLESIITNFNSTDFPRLKLGIGPVPPQIDAKDFVLSNFTPEELKIVNNMIEQTHKKIIEIIQK